MPRNVKDRLWKFMHGTDAYPRGMYIGNGRMLVKTRTGPILISSEDLSLMPFLSLWGTFEDELANWLVINLHPGATFVDVGANVGWFTVIGAKAVGPTGHVVAIEADPRNFELLLDNLGVNYVAEWVRPISVAAWREETLLTFHPSSKFRGNSSVAAPDDAYRQRYPGDRTQEITVQAVMLDELLADLGHIDVLKMDIEGAEAHALAGMSCLFSDNRVGTVVIEINRASAGEAWEPFADWLITQERAGWTITDLVTSQQLSAKATVAGGHFHNVVLQSPAPTK